MKPLNPLTRLYGRLRDRKKPVPLTRVYVGAGDEALKRELKRLRGSHKVRGIKVADIHAAVADAREVFAEHDSNLMLTHPYARRDVYIHVNPKRNRLKRRDSAKKPPQALDLILRYGGGGGWYISPDSGVMDALSNGPTGDSEVFIPDSVLTILKTPTSERHTIKHLLTLAPDYWLEGVKKMETETVKRVQKFVDRARTAITENSDELTRSLGEELLSAATQHARATHAYYERPDLNTHRERNRARTAYERVEAEFERAHSDRRY